VKFEEWESSVDLSLKLYTFPVNVTFRVLSFLFDVLDGLFEMLRNQCGGESIYRGREEGNCN
jgi:hypothetical protein